MTICRTSEEARAAGRKAGAQAPPLTQEQADLVAAILLPHIQPARAAA